MSITKGLIFKSASYSTRNYNRSSEVIPVVKQVWEKSIRSQLLLAINELLLESTLSTCYVLEHNARTNAISIRTGSIDAKQQKVSYKLNKYVCISDLFETDFSVNKTYFEMLIVLLMNNMDKLS